MIHLRSIADITSGMENLSVILAGSGYNTDYKEETCATEKLIAISTTCKTTCKTTYKTAVNLTTTPISLITLNASPTTAPSNAKTFSPTDTPTVSLRNPSIIQAISSMEPIIVYMIP